jgi:hypothetical protein
VLRGQRLINAVAGHVPTGQFSMTGSAGTTYQASGIQSINTGVFIATDPARIAFGDPVNRKQSRSLRTRPL